MLSLCVASSEAPHLQGTTRDQFILELDANRAIRVRLSDMIEEYVKEDLSRAYVRAVAGRVNVGIDESNRDMGIDGTFRRLKQYSGQKCYCGCSIDFQLKGTVDYVCNEKVVKYDLDVDMHNVLVERNHEYLTTDMRAAPFILVLLCMPRDEDEWLRLSEEELLLKRCCYWHLVTGPTTANKATVRVEIPRSQTFTPDSLLKLLNAVETGTLA